jgi:hypothetical protein
MAIDFWSNEERGPLLELTIEADEEFYLRVVLLHPQVIRMEYYLKSNGDFQQIF